MLIGSKHIGALDTVSKGAFQNDDFFYLDSIDYFSNDFHVDCNFASSWTEIHFFFRCCRPPSAIGFRNIK